MKFYFLLFISLFTSLNTFGQTTSSKPIIFILDASGSMWQQIGSDYKITLARDVLYDLVNGMPADQALGLVAYGHRQKGDCGDIEELLPSGNTDKTAFKKAITGLNPLGKTPLAQSARLVINQLKTSGTAATIILITDGIETCEGDLCQVVEEAKAAGIDFVLHVIGFDLGDADRASLQCAAQSSDGLYIDASDKEGLSDALNQTTDLTVDKAKGQLSVECRRNGELIDCAVVVTQKGREKDVAGMRTYGHPETNPALFNIPGGTYDLEVSVVGQRGIALQYKEDLVVSETELNEQVFDFSSGFLEVTVTSGGALHDAAVKILEHGSKKQVNAGRTYEGAASNPMKKELSPGIYDIEIGSVSIKGEAAKILLEGVEIKPGETTALAHQFESAILRVGTSFGGELCDATVNVILLNPRKSVDGKRTYTSATTNPATFLLSPGTYEVDVRGVKVEGDPREKFTITIEAGQEAEHTIAW
ncbi:MAG: VWA domain-containing protein [Saprospiraceae bacterium]|nr:VWA domain-containing protein [Saprospiraceae bacterium]